MSYPYSKRPMRLAVGVYVASSSLLTLPCQPVRAQLVNANGITVSASGTFTTAPGEPGLYALNGGVINGTGPVFITGDGYGAWANSGGRITLDGGSVTSQEGLFASDNGTINATGTTISTKGTGASIANFNDLNNTAMTLTDVDITTGYGTGV